MPTDKQQCAVVYCRVSSGKQVKKGDGLGSQETRCREYATYKGYEVVEVFRDEGVSGSMIDRPGMKAMLQILRKKRAEQYVVIIDDISRLARGLDAHLKLRAAIGSAGGKLESPSIEFGDDSDSLLVENMLASVSQHQREKNAEQTKNRTRARIMGGYWAFKAPIGYRYERVKDHGNMLVRDEPNASIIAEVLEGFASGRFETRAEIKRYLEAHNIFPKSQTDRVSWQKVTDILNRVLYAGHVEYLPWGVRLRQGHHEGLISFKTYQAIQKRLKDGAQAPARRDISADFPLRGFVTCGDCEKPMTASWPKGRGGHYAYYFCAQKGCASYAKSIRRAEVEDAFASMLGALSPSEELFDAALEMFRDLWDQRLASSVDQSASIRKELKETERNIEQLLDRIVGASGQEVIASYERRLQLMERKKAELREKVANCGRPLQSFDETFRTAFDFLQNPQKLWDFGVLEHRRTLLKLAFSDKLPYVRNEGFRTAPIALPFRVLAQLKGGDCGMVGAAGIEPATPTMST